MKIYEIRKERKNGDGFSSWSFVLAEAQQMAKHERAHMTAAENENANVCIIGYDITCTAAFDSAGALVDACFNDSINVPEYDACTGGFADDAQSYYEEIE